MNGDAEISAEGHDFIQSEIFFDVYFLEENFVVACCEFLSKIEIPNSFAGGSIGSNGILDQEPGCER